MTDTTHLKVGDTVLGRLKVVGLIGSGGCGHVYEVEHLVTHHHRALKVMQPDLLVSPKALTRFKREAGVAGTLKSPHVVEVYDCATLEDGSPFVLMELLEGQTLADRIEQQPLSEAELSLVALQVARGLAAAHDAGIIHRDIKPENIFLTKADDGEVLVKLLDFGVSKFHRLDNATTLTADGALVGTPYYMSPEQVRGERDIDARADLYSLGVVLYEALTGSVPFAGDSIPAIFVKIYNGDYPSLHGRPSQASPAFLELVEELMSLSPDDRPASAEALIELLESLRTSAPDSSRPALGRATDSVDSIPGLRRQDSKRILRNVAIGVLMLAIPIVAWAALGGSATDGSAADGSAADGSAADGSEANGSEANGSAAESDATNGDAVESEAAQNNPPPVLTNPPQDSEPAQESPTEPSETSPERATERREAVGLDSPRGEATRTQAAERGGEGSDRATQEDGARTGGSPPANVTPGLPSLDTRNPYSP